MEESNTFFWEQSNISHMFLHVRILESHIYTLLYVLYSAYYTKTHWYIYQARKHMVIVDSKMTWSDY